MKKVLLMISMFGILGFLASCTASPEKSVIQPTEGKLTFAFVYTEG